MASPVRRCRLHCRHRPIHTSTSRVRSWMAGTDLYRLSGGVRWRARTSIFRVPDHRGVGMVRRRPRRQDRPDSEGSGRRIHPHRGHPPRRQQPALASPRRAHPLLRAPGRVHRDLGGRALDCTPGDAQGDARGRAALRYLRPGRRARPAGRGRRRPGAGDPQPRAGAGRARRLSRGMPAAIARRMYQEFRRMDDAAPLAIEGLLLELLAGCRGGGASDLPAGNARGSARSATSCMPTSRRRPTLAELAEAVGRAPGDPGARVPAGLRLHASVNISAGSGSSGPPSSSAGDAAAGRDRAGGGIRRPEPLLQRLPPSDRHVPFGVPPRGPRPLSAGLAGQASRILSSSRPNRGIAPERSSIGSTLR